MNNTKCPRCGLVNWLTPEACERCGLPLDGGRYAEESAPIPARPDFPIGSYGMTGSTSGEPQQPPVWKWYVAYCAVMALMYLLVVIVGVVFFAVPAGAEMEPQEAQERQVSGLIFIVLGILFLAPYAAAPFLPRRRWAWVVGIVLISIGMTSTCCLPAAIPLLIYWLKPENKAFFGAGSEGRQGGLMAKDNPYKFNEEPFDLGMLLKMFAAGGLYVLAITFLPIFLIIGWLIFGLYGVAFVLVVSLIWIVWRVFRDKSSDAPSLNLNSRN